MVSKTKRKGSGNKGKDGQKRSGYKDDRKENKPNSNTAPKEQQQHFWQNEQIDQVLPQDRVAKVKPYWNQLEQQQRMELLAIPVSELQKRAVEVMKRNHQEMEQVMGQGDALLTLEIEHYPELLEAGLKRLRKKNTWKQWKWNIHGGQEFTEMEAFKTYVEENHIPLDLRDSLPRDDSKYETPEETALRKRMQELLAKVHNATKQFQDELQTSNNNQRKNRSNSSTKDNSTLICEKNIEFITIMLTELSKEHELLHRMVLIPLLDYIMDAVPENRRQSTRHELVYEDLEQLSSEEVNSISEWVLEKVDGLTAKWKIDPSDDQEEEEEEEGEEGQGSMGDVDLFMLKTQEDGSEMLCVNPKWLKHLQERTLGEDGQPRKLQESDDPSQGGLVLEWVYGSIVSTAEKARDGAKRSLSGRPVDQLRAFKTLLTGLQEHNNWGQYKEHRTNTLAVLDQDVDFEDLSQVLEYQHALITAPLLHLTWLQTNANEEIKNLGTQLYQNQISIQRNQKLMEAARATREALGASGNVGGPNAALANQKVQEQMELQAIINNTNISIQQLVQKKAKLEQEVLERQDQIQRIRQQLEQVAELQNLLRLCQEAIVQGEEVTITQIAYATARNPVQITSNDPASIIQQVEAYVAQQYPRDQHEQKLQELKHTLKKEEEVCAEKCRQLRAVLGHLEMQFLNIACDDPGSTIGMHIALPILQERLDAKAFVYAKKLADEAKDEVLKLMEEEDQKQQEMKKRKASKKAKVKEAQRAERESSQKDDKRQNQELEVLKSIEEAQEQQKMKERLEEQARKIEKEKRKIEEEYEAALERRRQQLLEEERQKQKQRDEEQRQQLILQQEKVKELQSQTEQNLIAQQTAAELSHNLDQSEENLDTEVRPKEDTQCCVSSDSLSSDHEQRSMDAVLDAVQDPSWPVSSKKQLLTNQQVSQNVLEELDRSSSTDSGFLPSVSNQAKRNRSSSSAFSSQDGRGLPPVDEEMNGDVGIGVQNDQEPEEREKQVTFVLLKSEDVAMPHLPESLQLSQEQDSQQPQQQQVCSPGVPLPPPHPLPSMFGPPPMYRPIPNGSLPTPLPAVQPLYPDQFPPAPTGMVPMPPPPMGGYSHQPPLPYPMSWIPPYPSPFPPPPTLSPHAFTHTPLLTTRSGNVLLNPQAKEFIPRMSSVDHAFQPNTHIQEAIDHSQMSPKLPDTISSGSQTEDQTEFQIVQLSEEISQQDLEDTCAAPDGTSVVDQFVEEQAEVVQVVPKGMVNETGSSNCFLNAIVQSLWHLPSFKEVFLAAKPVNKNDIDSDAFNALFEIFQCMYKDHEGAENAEKSVSPSQLRKAMSVMGDGFSVNDMHDASEALCELFSAMCRAQLDDDATDPLLPIREKLPIGNVGIGGNLPQSIVAEQFGIAVQTVIGSVADEQNIMEVENYMKYFHLIPAQALRQAYQQLIDEEYEVILHWAEHIETMNSKVIDNQTRLPAQPYLIRCPKVFTVVLVWESAVAPQDSVRETVVAIKPTLNIAKLFNGVQEPASYQLLGIVSYQRHHYNACAYNLAMKKWCLFDDEVVTIIGDYKNVIQKIQASLWQPVMLFYGEASA
eukprot:TRINITY_DN2962_c0_g1_i2.p1 TRINITY_DN2962_c0_g1~~TRINITY_DN2962_c0_g1_i2.p1  ORF type:complete len:1581 (-),score=229.11 TRINITY_DN2962_c0_g1_i2:2728-7470(-)